MRTLTIALLSLFISFSAACATDDETTDTDSPIGQGPDGGSSGSTCGDGVCNATAGENKENCLKDCSGRCDAVPGNPVFCLDSRGNPTCNPVGTDCTLPTMYGCGSGPRRCPNHAAFGRCCDTDDGASSDIVWCPDRASCEMPVSAPRTCYDAVFSCASGS